MLALINHRHSRKHTHARRTDGRVNEHGRVQISVATGRVVERHDGLHRRLFEATQRVALLNQQRRVDVLVCERRLQKHEDVLDHVLVADGRQRSTPRTQPSPRAHEYAHTHKHQHGRDTQQTRARSVTIVAPPQDRTDEGTYVMKSRNWASAPVAIERRYWNSMTHLAVARFSTTAGIVGGGCERTHATNRGNGQRAHTHRHTLATPCNVQHRELRATAWRGTRNKNANAEEGMRKVKTTSRRCHTRHTALHRELLERRHKRHTATLIREGARPCDHRVARW